MESLKKGIFDSNTITFVASFLLVFLGGVLLGINERAEKIAERAGNTFNILEARYSSILNRYEEQFRQLKTQFSTDLNQLETRTCKAESQFETERITMDLYTQIHILRFFSTNIQNELRSKNYCIDQSTNIRTNELFTMADELLNDIHKEKYKFIAEGWKKVFDDIFEKMIDAFNEEDILLVKENKDKTQPIVMTINKLKELQTKISTL